MTLPTFTRVCIGALGNAPDMNTLFNVADLNCDGRPDIFSTGRNGLMAWFGDIDGDGRPEIVISEGDACIYGSPQGGKLGWFKPGRDIHMLWVEHRIEENLLDPHSLQLSDLCGHGRLDLVVGEIGKRETLAQEPPRLMLYENLGGGRFKRHIIEQGIGTHHARLADFRGTGRLDIASRPLHGPEQGRIFVWFNEGFR